MSTFPAFATGISGMLAGTWIMGKYDWERKVTGLFAAGFIALAAGVVWSWVFPLNENLWTSSFVMVTSGLASMVLGLSIWVTDILGKSKGAWPGVVFGSNAITAYVLADILAIIFYGINFGGAALNDHFFSMATSAGIAPKLASMIYAILFVTVNFVPVYLLYRKKIFIKL
jgi:predicted acyltransferase